MTIRSHSFTANKHSARVLLAMFLLSVINMSMQLPAHGAMQLQMKNQQMSAQMNKQMTHSMDMDMDMDMVMDNESMSETMMDCHCPPALCDSVLAFDNQSADGLYPVETGAEKNLTFIIEILNQNQGQLNQQQAYAAHQLHAEQTAQPPLLTKTLLLI